MMDILASERNVWNNKSVPNNPDICILNHDNTSKKQQEVYSGRNIVHNRGILKSHDHALTYDVPI